jgi:hypothetical protein
MPGGSVPADLANRLDILVHLGATGDLADAYLLGRFLGSEDAASRAAFAALVDSRVVERWRLPPPPNSPRGFFLP